MAALLGREAAAIKNIRILHPVEANGVFASLPSRHIPALQKEYFFYLFDEKIPAVRWMTSWDTQEEDVRGLLEVLREKMGQ
jgi:threonine aldolase